MYEVYDVGTGAVIKSYEDEDMAEAFMHTLIMRGWDGEWLGVRKAKDTRYEDGCWNYSPWQGYNR